MTQDPKIAPETPHGFTIDLSNQFLMAMPGMVTGELAGTVIYVCEHGPKGALGLVINRPTDLSLSSLLEKIDLKLEISPFQTNTVFYGGPVQTDRGFVLHTPLGDYSSSIKLGPLTLTTSRDVLQEVAVDRLLRRLALAQQNAGQAFLLGGLAVAAALLVTSSQPALVALPLLLGLPVGLGWLRGQARLARDGRLDQLSR
jgi:putative AlgH/UPF0301 family transcriptional regulator